MIPVELQVIGASLRAIAEEMGAALIRSAFSANIKERRDCSTALFDERGRMITQAEHIPVHLGAMPEAVAAVMAHDPAPGEPWILNDPYAGGTHLPDLTIVTRTELGYAVTRAHHADVGGSEPGSLPPESRTLAEEGVIIAPTHLDGDTLESLVERMRNPDERRGDLRAQLAAHRLAEGRVHELCARRGRNRVAAAMDELLAYSERVVRAAIRELPDGLYEGADLLETRAGLLDIRAAVTIEGDSIDIDFAGTAPQYDAPLSKALADYPEVVFRTSPFFPDGSAYANNALRRDLLGTAAWLADRWPAVVRLRLPWKAVQLHGYLSGWFDILREINRHRTPVLHIQWSKIPFLDVWLMRRAQRRGVRIVYTVHNALPHNVRTESARRAYRKLYRQADALIVLSGSVGQQVLARVDNSVADKIHVIEHGILELACPLPNRQEARLELNVGPDADVVVFMGGIRAYKGITDLIDAIDIARRDRPKLRLIIAGMPQEPFDPYQAQIQRLALNGIVQAHPRYVSEQFKAAVYAAADVVVLPHRDPSQSSMGLEALGAGKPIIVTRGGGLVELVDENVNGYIAPVRDPAALAQALIRFFNLPRSRQEAMAAASRALGRERFAWSLVARKHVDLYRRRAVKESLAHRARSDPQR